MKQVDELFVGISVEGQRAVIGVKRHFQHACLGTGQSSIGKTFAISVKVELMTYLSYKIAANYG